MKSRSPRIQPECPQYPDGVAVDERSDDVDVQAWLERWDLTPDGEPFITRTGRLVPVRYRGLPAMLKVVTEPEERDGSRVMAWWAGQGAARVYELTHDAVLLERATGPRSLSTMAHTGLDDEATAVLCSVAATLHIKDPADRPSTIVPLDQWFRALWPAASNGGGILAVGAKAARKLLADQRDVVVLHGDLHHGNVRDFGADRGGRGWLAIDPKGLYGERTFDYVNLLRNPDPALALAPGRFKAQVDLVARSAGLNPKRLMEWTLAFTCLSAAWYLDDGEVPVSDLAIAELALVQLG